MGLKGMRLMSLAQSGAAVEPIVAATFSQIDARLFSEL
jgi:hypothetical protein